MADNTVTGAREPLWAYAPTFVAGALFLWFAGMVPQVAAGTPLTLSWSWVPSLGINAAFLIDGLSLTFALLISGIGTLVMLYSARYLGAHPQFMRFALYLTAFMGAMLGLVTASNLLMLFVFWELTTLTSYLLIGFGHEAAKSRRAALQALLVTGMGGLAMLAGFILIGMVVGSYEMQDVLASGDTLVESGLFTPILLLVLAGAFTKSAQFPLHFWLPNAMAAPTPVSAFLHSATMVKGGVYLLARMHPAFSDSGLWVWALAIAGGVTAVFASIMALKQTDLKQSLAYTTLMALGTLVLFLSDSGAYAVTGAVTFLIVHSLYKACLFLMVGVIDHATGSRDAEVLGGLGRKLPFTAFAAALAGLSMAGLPPFFGFIGKELLYKGGEYAASSPVYVIAMSVVANALMLAVAGIVAFKPFWGKAGPEMPKVGNAPWQMVAGPLVLGVLGLAFGVAPWLVQKPLIDPTVMAIAGIEAKALHLWAGVNLALFLSLATFALGFVLYAVHVPLRNWLRATDWMSFDRGWDGFLDGVKSLAAWQTRKLQSGLLHNYLFTVFAALFVVMSLSLWLRVGVPNITVPFLLVKEWAVAVLILAGTGLTLWTRSRIAAICGLGVGGIGVALIFIIYGAPDVAITQLLVETLVVVLMAVAILRLPFLGPDSGVRPRPYDAVLAIGVGVVAAVVVLLVIEVPVDRRLTDYFEATSWPEAHGRNIVNVILVDFRALDTFGEVAVVAIAALSSFALLRGVLRKKS